LLELELCSWHIHGVVWLEYKAHDQYVDNTIFGDMKNNTKQFWSYLKSKKQDSQGVTPLRKDDGYLAAYDGFISFILQ
jgi:hypothetical protein